MKQQASTWIAIISIAGALMLGPAAAIAQSSGGSGGSSGGSSGSSSGGSSTGGGIGAGSRGGSTANQLAPNAMPGGATPQERVRQRSQQLRDSAGPTQPDPGIGDDRGRTTDVRRGTETEPENRGLPTRSDPGRREPNELSGGGSARQGAVGKTMAECEAAWDSKTHMSKETWRDTCQRTLTEPHL